MIDTQAIKNRILNLAMRGQMSEQMPEDGTAEGLYNQIVEEKTKLIKEGRIKKEKSLGEISDEEIPFEIPSRWKWVRLCDVSYHIWAGGDKPSDFSKEYDDDRTVPVVANGVTNEGILGYTSKATANKNTITVAGRGTIGFTILRRYDYCPIVRLIVIEQSRFINPKYLQFFLQMMPEASVGSSIPQLTVPMIKPKLVPLPPVSEQTRIVEKIEAVFEVLEKIDALQNQYASNQEVLKSKLIDAAIQGKLTEQLPEDGTADALYHSILEEKQLLIKAGKLKKEKSLPEIIEDEIPFEIPENWRWVRISDVIDVRDGTHDSPKYHDEGIPLVTSKNISSGKLIFEDAKLVSMDDAQKIDERSCVDDGDILFAMIGSIGNPVIVHKDREFCIKNVALFKNFAPMHISMDYFYWFLMHEQFVLKKNAIGGLQPFVSLKVFRSYLMPLPPMSEQIRIAERLYELEDVVLEQEK